MSKTVTVYAYNELSREAQAYARKRYLSVPDCEQTLSECMASLKALCRVAGVSLKDWSVGPYSRGSYVKVAFDYAEEADICGPRLFAWVENRIFGRLRQPWVLKAKGRKYTRPGHVPACPLTGVCFDEDLLDVFRDRSLSWCLKDRFDHLADVIGRICEAVLEYQAGEGLEERAELEFDGVEFTEEGRRI